MHLVEHKSRSTSRMSGPIWNTAISFSINHQPMESYLEIILVQIWKILNQFKFKQLMLFPVHGKVPQQLRYIENLVGSGNRNVVGTVG